MLNLLSTLSNLLTTFINNVINIFTFLYNTLMSILQFIMQIPQFTTFLSTGINAMPTLLLPFFTASISLYVVLRIINREV